jgi:hypothetical protein
LSEAIADEVCRACLNEEPNKTCNYFVQRMVGECNAQEIKEIIAAGEKKYKVSRGIYFLPDTSNELIKILHDLYLKEERVRFHWGDGKTGLDWGDVYGVFGRLGITTGKQKMYILVHNSRSTGGPLIMTDSIVRIDWANKKGHAFNNAIYRSTKYHVEKE